MKLSPGDLLQMKKSHPCGGDRFSVMRAGMDVRLRCERCGHEVLLPRAKAEKSVKRLVVSD